MTLDDLGFQGNAKQDLYLLVWQNTELPKVPKEINGVYEFFYITLKTYFYIVCYIPMILMKTKLRLSVLVTKDLVFCQVI